MQDNAMSAIAERVHERADTSFPMCANYKVKDGATTATESIAMSSTTTIVNATTDGP